MPSRDDGTMFGDTTDCCGKQSALLLLLLRSVGTDSVEMTEVVDCCLVFTMGGYCCQMWPPWWRMCARVVIAADSSLEPRSGPRTWHLLFGPEEQKQV